LWDNFFKKNEVSECEKNKIIYYKVLGANKDLDIGFLS
jgi:hypothetical protein